VGGAWESAASGWGLGEYCKWVGPGRVLQVGGAWESTASGWGLGMRLVLKGWSLPYAPYQQLRPGILIPYTKEGMELLCFLPYTIGSKDKCVCSQWSSADFQYGQTVKSHFAVQSSSKVTV